MELLSSRSQPPSGSSTESPETSCGLHEDSSTSPDNIVVESVSMTPITGVLERYDNFVKSEADKRVYRGLLLTNKLKVLLVSDPSTDESAAGLEVQVGSFNDPDEIPGLAHFCEHMVFLGTKKYPEENKFEKFLTENGGYANAYTTADSTVFYFSIRPPHLCQGLDIFAQFFISPNFTESATDRELNAVNSEHENNITKDAWRLFAIHKHICDVTHPYHKFNTGNKETLQTIPESKGINVRDELLKFHSKWYSANIMSLVVLGKESLNELEAMVAPLFSAIQNNSITAPSWPVAPFPPELRRKRIFGIPIKDDRCLELFFPIPYTLKYYKSKPTRYLAHLLHHEGPGSLLSAFKKTGWSNNTFVTAYTVARGFSFFVIEVDLTEEGLNHIDDIVNWTFQYIAMLKTQGPQKWIWEECKKLMEIKFQFKDTADPIDLVLDHVSLLQDYPMEDVLSIYNLNPEWNPDLIIEILSFLTPENMNLYIIAQAFEEKCTMSVPWYGAKYWVEDIDDSILKEWKKVQLREELKLPSPNDCIPTSLALDEQFDPTSEDVAPAIIKDSKLMRLWYKKDNEFLLPKALITFDLISPLAYLDPVNANLTKLLVENLLDGLQEITYSAILAGLSWSVTQIKQYGINISIEGYDDKIHVLLDLIIDHLVSFKVDPKRFDIITENRTRDIKNVEANQPNELAAGEENVCLSSVYWNTSDEVDLVKGLTPKQLEEFAANFIRKVHIEGLMYGNLSRERAIKIADSVENKFPKDGIPLYAEELLLNRDIELDKGVWYVRQIHNSVHQTSCASLYYACGENELRQNVMLNLLTNLLYEPCYSTLRTQEQLGYLVHSKSCFFNGSQGLRITVQSHKHPYFLEQRIEAFLHNFVEHLENLSDEEFSKHKAAILANILEKPKQMSTKFYGLWNEIAIQVYNFDRARLEEEELKKITKDEILQFYKHHLSVDSPERQKLSVYVVSTVEGGADNENTKDQEPEEKTPDEKKEEMLSGEQENVPKETELVTNKNDATKVDKQHIEEIKLDINKNENHLEEKLTRENEWNMEKLHELLNTDKKPEIISDLLEFKSRRRLCPNPVTFANISRKGINI